MAPLQFMITAPEASVIPGILGLVVVAVAVILCAKTDKKKPQRMKKVQEFSEIKTSGVPNINLSTMVPIQSPDTNMPEKKDNHDNAKTLSIDAMKILRKAFKNDASLTKFTIAEKQLQLIEIIGAGNFGLVYKGTLLDKNLSNPKEVAVKTVHGNSCSAEDVEMFIKESARMRGFSHQNVMCISGIVTKDNKPYIVIPYMSNGDLKSFVSSKNLRFTLEDLTKFGYQVAQGMSYLSNKNFIHRDLAARNCMVSADRTVKVADFGLSRDLYEAEYYKMSNLATPLPIRWVALESVLSSKFTSKSDVWSFGVLLWELVTRGRTPYYDIKDNLEVIKFIKSGKRMECPSYVTNDIVKIIKKCWMTNPKMRPSFAEVCTMIHYVLEGENDYEKPIKRK